jgi:hypothetical protein
VSWCVYLKLVSFLFAPYVVFFEGDKLKGVIATFIHGTGWRFTHVIAF